MYEDSAMWIPKTRLGKDVFEGKVTSLEDIFRSGKKIKEAGIVDRLVPNLKSELVFIGGSPGKGGGSKKTPTKRTVRMHRSGRRYKISAVVVVGNENGYFGVGKSEALEHNEAIRKATENAKLSIVSIRRGCGSWECRCGEKHSIPVETEGKKGSVKVKLKPAPKGIGLCINDEAKKALKLAGIKDIWSKDFGESRSRVNYMFAIFNAFKKINRMKMPDYVEKSEAKEEEKPAEKEMAEKETAKEAEPKEEEQKEKKLGKALPEEKAEPAIKEEKSKERIKKKPVKKKTKKESKKKEE